MVVVAENPPVYVHLLQYWATFLPIRHSRNFEKRKKLFLRTTGASSSYITY